MTESKLSAYNTQTSPRPAQKIARGSPMSSNRNMRPAVNLKSNYSTAQAIKSRPETSTTLRRDN